MNTVYQNQTIISSKKIPKTTLEQTSWDWPSEWVAGRPNRLIKSAFFHRAMLLRVRAPY